jgi:hypothetical protein
MAGKKNKKKEAKGKDKKDKRDKKDKPEVRSKAAEKAKAAKPAPSAHKAAVPAKAPAPVKAGTPAKGGEAAGAVPGKPAPGKPAPGKPAGGRPAKKSGRKSSLSQRRGPDGQLLAPGELLLPGGATSLEEVHYLFRGSVAAEHAAGEAGVTEVLTKRGIPDTDANRVELDKQRDGFLKRFESGTIEPMLPTRGQVRRNFPGVVERAKQRRREIGAFLRGLDLGRTETSHMDSHGEASLQSLMEWAARLENLAEADEPDQADYNQFHRGLDQLENTTEALIIDVELTLRRLRDRIRAK